MFRDLLILSAVVEGSEVFLRLYHSGTTFAFHYSIDGRYWNLVRYFTLGALTNLSVGFSAQSPTGPGCQATFSAIAYAARAIKDIRSGE